ncbi:MAG: MarR family winged helix-turn-helix transcriptional regulator [Chloroflexota bacterium]
MQGHAVKSFDHRLGFALKRALHVLRNRMDDALREIELTTPQYAALSAIEHEPWLSNAELARRCLVTPQTMNGVVVNLEAARLVVRSPDGDDGRLLRVSLTGEGRRRLAEAHRRVLEVEARMVSAIDDQRQSELIEALHACADALERPTV